MHTQKTGSDLQLIASHPVFQFEAWFFPGSFYRGLVMNLANRKFQSGRISAASQE